MLVIFTVAFIVDTGIANEKDWGISLLNENVNEAGTNEDGSTWYRESGEDVGDEDGSTDVDGLGIAIIIKISIFTIYFCLTTHHIPIGCWNYCLQIDVGGSQIDLGYVM